MSFSTFLRWSGSSAMLGGVLWISFWSLHTIAHGPRNPAPTGQMFLGRTSEGWAMIMLRVAPILLLVGLLGLHQWHKKRLGVIGIGGVALCFIGLTMLLLFGFEVGEWILYVLGFVVTYLGLILFGLAALRARILPPWSRAVPLLMGCLPPLIDRARQPGSFLLQRGEAMGYLLLESYGAVFGIGWILLGYSLWRAHHEPKDNRTTR